MAELIDRSPIGLVDALCKRLEEVLESFWVPVEQPEGGDSEKYHVPHVHAQYLPVSLAASMEREESKDFPFALVYCSGGSITKFSPAITGDEIHITLYFGGYRDDPDNQGWRLPERMRQRVAQDLCAETVLNGYQLVPPTDWALPIEDSPPYFEPPYYFALMKTIWKGAPPSVEVPAMGIYGNENPREF